MATDSSQEFIYQYLMRFEDGHKKSFSIHIDKANNNFISAGQTDLPFWSEIDYQRCSNCTLLKSDCSFCPVATNLIPLLELCSDIVSFSNVDYRIDTPERTIIGNTSMQRLLSSMLGLVIATSPCPHAEYLKPMARFHLPLASELETIYRTTSTFLLGQYFLHKADLPFTQNLDKLTEIYDNLKIVNRSLAKRLRAASNQDASINAIILLDVLTQSVTWSIEDGLEELRHLFQRYERE
jgi:hypothetical protein